MAAQGRCNTCKAAFTFPERKQYPPCPICGAALARTTYQYAGPWFSVEGATFRAPVSFAPMPLTIGDDTTAPAIRVVYFTYVIACHTAENCAYSLQWHREHEHQYNGSAAKVADAERAAQDAERRKAAAYDRWQVAIRRLAA